jgi:hypothetical protein
MLMWGGAAGSAAATNGPIASQNIAAETTPRPFIELLDPVDKASFLS